MRRTKQIVVFLKSKNNGLVWITSISPRNRQLNCLPELTKQLCFFGIDECCIPFLPFLGVLGVKVDEEDQVAAGSSVSSEPLTMFVKNLSFSTTEAGLKTCFERAGLSVRSVSIPRKKGQGSSEAMLSSGFGFVECADRGLVEKALKVGGWVDGLVEKSLLTLLPGRSFGGVNYLDNIVLPVIFLLVGRFVETIP